MGTTGMGGGLVHRVVIMEGEVSCLTRHDFSKNVQLADKAIAMVCRFPNRKFACKSKTISSDLITTGPGTRNPRRPRKFFSLPLKNRRGPATTAIPTHGKGVSEGSCRASKQSTCKHHTGAGMDTLLIYAFRSPTCGEL